MYNGKKDWRPPVEVPASCCYETQIGGRTMIEVRIPVKYVPEYTQNVVMEGQGVLYVNWKSFMVAPCQVYHKTNDMNVITDINQQAQVTIYCHYFIDVGDGRGPIYKMDRNTQEKLDVFQIMSRINAYFI